MNWAYQIEPYYHRGKLIGIDLINPMLNRVVKSVIPAEFRQLYQFKLSMSNIKKIEKLIKRG